MSARTFSLGLAIAFAAACDPRIPIAGGARVFDEIDVPAATRSVAQEGARLVQVREPGSPAARVAAAVVVAPADPVPDEWLRGARPIVVIAGDTTAARRLAVRLLRLGAARVSVVRGGIEGWLEPREPTTDARVGLSSPRTLNNQAGPKPRGESIHGSSR